MKCCIFRKAASLTSDTVPTCFLDVRWTYCCPAAHWNTRKKHEESWEFFEEVKIHLHTFVTSALDGDEVHLPAIFHAGNQSFLPIYLSTAWADPWCPIAWWTWWLRQISCPCRELNSSPSYRSQSLLSWLCFCTSFWRYCTYEISTSIGQSPYIPIGIVSDFP